MLRDAAGLPCTRGDSPIRDLSIRGSARSALHTRGFTQEAALRKPRSRVCPAHAGIHLGGNRPRRGPLCLPCTRGDSPCGAIARANTAGSALHTRGFTLYGPRPSLANPVCPAHAGIHRGRHIRDSSSRSLPCTRGDSPYYEQSGGLTFTSALHTRGFTHVSPDQSASDQVCPAHAGIHRGQPGCRGGRGRLPCTRGDSPDGGMTCWMTGRSALHTRGFTRPGFHGAPGLIVCPAHAGIHPLGYPYR